MMLMMGRAVDLCILLAFVMLPSHVLGQAAVGEGEKCNPSLPPAHALLCTQGLYCSTSRPGAFGACMKCTPEKCRRPLLGNTTIVVAHEGAGWEHLSSLLSGAMGASTTEGEAGEAHPQQSFATEGEECKPSLPPPHAIVCNDGLFCSAAMPGAAGICRKCTPESCERPQTGAVVVEEIAIPGEVHPERPNTDGTQRTTVSGTPGAVHPELAIVGEGGRCNPTLPPADAILCRDKLYCETAPGKRGGFGTCAKCLPGHCEPPRPILASIGQDSHAGDVHVERAVVGEGETCNPSLPPAFAISCSEGLHCAAKVLRGGYGTCTESP